MKYLQDIVPAQPNQMEKHNNYDATDWYNQFPYIRLLVHLSRLQTFKVMKSDNIFNKTCFYWISELPSNRQKEKLFCHNLLKYLHFLSENLKESYSQSWLSSEWATHTCRQRETHICFTFFLIIILLSFSLSPCLCKNNYYQLYMSCGCCYCHMCSYYLLSIFASPYISTLFHS